MKYIVIFLFFSACVPAIHAQVFLEPDSNFIQLSDSITVDEIKDAVLRSDSLKMVNKELSDCDSAKYHYRKSLKEKDQAIKQKDFQLYNQNVMLSDDKKEIAVLRVNKFWSTVKTYTIEILGVVSVVQGIVLYIHK